MKLWVVCARSKCAEASRALALQNYYYPAVLLKGETKMYIIKNIIKI